jgi:hypothetical protein
VLLQHQHQSADIQLVSTASLPRGHLLHDFSQFGTSICFRDMQSGTDSVIQFQAHGDSSALAALPGKGIGEAFITTPAECRLTATGTANM